jgi:hypothetical protein
MKALRVYLPDDDMARLERWAGRKGWTKSQAVRVAIRALTRERGTDDAFLASSGMIEGLPADASENFDAYLDKTFVAGRRPRSARRK